MDKDFGADPALAKAEPVSRLGPSGFDPGEGGFRCVHCGHRDPNGPSLRATIGKMLDVLALHISNERRLAIDPVSESERAGAMHRADALSKALEDLARIEPLRDRLAKSAAWQEMLRDSDTRPKDGDAKQGSTRE